MSIDTSGILRMPQAEYDEGRATHLTSHGLMYYLKSPRMHQLKSTGLMLSKPSKSFTIGSATHMLVLEGRREFEKHYYSPMPGTEPVNEKTGKPYGATSEKYKAWLESSAKGRTVLTPSDYNLVNGMSTAVANHSQASYLLGEGEPEGVIRTEIQGVPVQVRIDWLNVNAGIVDLKTITDLDDFEQQFQDFRYGLQFAFYQMVAERVLGKCLPFYAVVVEKNPTHRVGVFTVNQYLMETHRRTVEYGISKYADSLRDNYWPTGYEKIRTIGGEP